MGNIFETFKPKNSLIAKYVSYYYLEIKPNNTKTEFDFFPHFNSSISLYNSHFSTKKGNITFDKNAKPFQIFTPIRENIIHVEQIGRIHRVVIVFNPLGVHQFYKNINFTELISNFPFFSNKELYQLFETNNINAITNIIDQLLLNKYVEYKNDILSKSIQLILDNSCTYTVEQIATKVDVSRRHLNRLFSSHFGVSVKKFNEIVLFRRTLEQKILKDTKQNITSLAHEFNYHDQSHLSKTYKKFTSHPPKKFLKKGTHLGNEDLFWHIKK